MANRREWSVDIGKQRAWSNSSMADGCPTRSFTYSRAIGLNRGGAGVDFLNAGSISVIRVRHWTVKIGLARGGQLGSRRRSFPSIVRSAVESVRARYQELAIVDDVTAIIDILTFTAIITIDTYASLFI